MVNHSNTQLLEEYSSENMLLCKKEEDVTTSNS